MKNKIERIFNRFEHASEFVSFSELTSGHINDTYLVQTKEKPYYVLQRINHQVFKDVPGLVNNKVLISNHLREKYAHLSEEEVKRKVLVFAKAKGESKYYLKDGEDYWNMMVFIDDSKTFEIVKDEDVAYEGGKLFGGFLNMTKDFDASKLIDVIPRFHDMSFRFAQFEDALQVASNERLEEAKNEIETVWELKDEMHIIQNLKESGEIRTIVAHNDTKISNALFGLDDKGLCVIDTDTVMPGVIHYDFGDAIRTICNTAAEDESDLTKVNFNMTFYNAYKKGFLEDLEQALTAIELRHLPLAGKTMTFIMAIRFLTDFLNNDIYYKTDYPKHNLVRSRNQLKLIRSMMKAFHRDGISLY